MARMKIITITEKNANWVIGRLNRFFKHDKMLVWHQFDCGIRKRLGSIIDLGVNSRPFNNPKKMVDVTRMYDGVSFRKYNNPYIVDYYRDTVACIDLNYDEGYTIGIGDKIVFLGNRIIVRNNFNMIGHQYLYTCFQICN